MYYSNRNKFHTSLYKFDQVDLEGKKKKKQTDVYVLKWL